MDLWPSRFGTPYIGRLALLISPLPSRRSHRCWDYANGGGAVQDLGGSENGAAELAAETTVSKSHGRVLFYVISNETACSVFPFVYLLYTS